MGAIDRAAIVRGGNCPGAIVRGAIVLDPLRLNGESQSHSPAHMLMILYRIKIHL
jgi:hypothetical protein